MGHQYCRLLILPVLLLLLTGQALAAGTAEQADQEAVVAAQSDALGLDELERAAEGYTGGAALSPGMDWDDGIQQIVDTGSGQLSGVVRRAVRSGVLLLAVVLLCGLAGGLNGALGSGAGLDPVTVAGTLAITALAVSDVHTLGGLGREALEQMNLFSQVLLPVVTAAAAAAGAPTGAAARQLATVLFSNVLMNLISHLLLPLVYGYIAASAAYAALGSEGLKRIAALLRWVVTTALTTLLLVFVGYLTVSGVVAGTADAAAVKTAKLTIAGVVPVVGGILSDAAETVLAGAGILRNTIGVFGMLVVLALCVAPFLQLGVHYLAYKVTAALTATVSDSRIAGLIDSIGGAFGLVLGMTGAGALLLLVSMVSAITAATP